MSWKTKQYSSWLLICDNADELVSLRNCWPDETWGGCGKVLVTIQDSSNVPFTDPSCRHISLSCGMKMDDALSLLRSISQLSCDDEELEYSVVKALNFQPLAIACAAPMFAISITMQLQVISLRVIRPGETTSRNLKWEKGV